MIKYSKHLPAILLIIVLMCTMLVLPAMAEETVTEVSSYEDLVTAFQNGGNIKLTDSITVESDLNNAAAGVFHVAEDTAVVLDLNGQTITATDNSDGNFSLFYSYGTLTIKDSADSGQITLTSAYNREWNASSSIFTNRGGNLTISGGTFTHKGGSAMAYVVDNNANSYGDATTNINGGVLTSVYIGIRNRMDTYGANGGGNGVAILNISGGSISGKYAVWGQVSSTAAKGSITVTNGTLVSAEGKDALLIGTDSTPIEGGIVTTVSGGTFSSDVSQYVASGNTVSDPDGDGKYTIVVDTATAVAEVDGCGYTDLAKAIATANGKTVTLLKNITLNNTVTIKAGNTVTLDLNGKVINGIDNCRIALMSYGNLIIKDSSEAKTGAVKAGTTSNKAGNAINICAGSFTLESGNIYSVNNALLIDEEAATIIIKGGTITAEPTTKNSAVMYISSTKETTVQISDCTMVGYNGILLWNNTTINMTSGSIEARGSVGIQGNGTHDNTEINISGNASISGYYTAIYHPQGGKLNISGNASLTGWTGVVVKGGTVKISGGTISGTGAADTYQPVSSGFVDTGDGLYVEHYDNSTNSENYGTPTVTVTGGTFNSTNANAVASYANTTNNVEALDAFITGGTFSTNPSAYLATGYCVKESDSKFVVGTHKLETCSSETAHWTECFHCGDKTQEITHSFTEEIVHDALLKSAATCTEVAVYYKTCACSVPSTTDTFTHGTALGHSMTHNEKVAATCTEDGTLEHYYCTTCKKNFSDDAGTKELTTIVDPALNHDKVLVKEAPATCTVNGTAAHYDCSRCDVLFNMDGQEVTADKLVITAQHTWESAQNDTHHFERCTICEDTRNEQAHKYYEEWIPSIDYHCHMCETCGYETDKAKHGKFIEKQDLAYLVSANDCVEFYFKQCEVCGKAGSEDDLFTVARTDATHVWGEGTVTTPATCTTKGVKTFSCTTKGCSATRTEEIAVIPHTEVTVPGKLATCTEVGLTDGKKCDICGTTTVEQETVPVKDHMLETVAAVDATYFAAGNIAHNKCSVCSKLFDTEGKELTSADVVIPQLIIVEDNKADVSTDVVDNAIKESETTGKVDIIIDVTKDEMANEETNPGGGTTEPAPAPVVTKAELPVESLEKVSTISNEATLTVNMTTATVTMDNKTLEVIAEEAKNSGTSAITLEIEHIETKELNEKQQEAVEDLEVAVTISASILNNGEEIHNFKGGNVTVAVPFTPAEGTKGSDYTVYYVADDGKVTKVPTRYSNGSLVFSIGHFSEYIVVNTSVVNEDLLTNGTPATGDSTDVMLMSFVMILSFAMTAVLITGTKKSIV